jgi:cytochrome c oxidase assembly factor CtaG
MSESLFSAHMVQHELMMVVAAPLLVLGHPFIAALWALPPAGRGAAGRIVRSALICRIRDALTYPPLAWSLQGVALCVWHAPALFQRTLTSDAVHTAQHLSFLFTALLFWWVLADHRRRLGPGAAVLYVFGTALYTGGLGALLTFAGRPWYPAYAPTTAAWGLSPLEDQQLGGLIMWIPGGVSYLVAVLVILARWLRSENDAAPASAFLRPTTVPRTPGTTPASIT